MPCLRTIFNIIIRVCVCVWGGGGGGGGGANWLCDLNAIYTDHMNSKLFSFDWN